MENKTLIACVTYGNFEFTKHAIESVKETTTHPFDLFVIVGMPGDSQTASWLDGEGIPYIMHKENYGFPYGLNDIYDYAWKEHDYSYLILFGNDIICYPYAVDSLIEQANSSDYDLICANEYSVKNLIEDFPQVKPYFSGQFLKFSDFSSKCWNLFSGYQKEPIVGDHSLENVQNLALYKKSVFDVVGYTDVSFYPAYFVDNDYARRIDLAGLKYCCMLNARFFHFWSRTIHQVITDGSNHHYFRNNERYYINKWGGRFGQETKTPDLRISSRKEELVTISCWKMV